MAQSSETAEQARDTYGHRAAQLADMFPEDQSDQSKLPPRDRYPKLYFFYRSLMDPKRLGHVLGLTTKPEPWPARLPGYKCMLWGPYPALLDDPHALVHGVVYEVQSKGDAQRLQHYETSNYKSVECTPKLEDGTELVGSMTFVWAGDRRDLREGTFDLKAWQLQEYGALVEEWDLEVVEQKGQRI